MRCCVLSECESLTLCLNGAGPSRLKVSTLYVSFSVGAVVVVALSVGTVSSVSNVSAQSVDLIDSQTNDRLSSRHRRELLSDTVLIHNDTVLDGNDTVLNGTAGNDTAGVTLSATRPAHKPPYLDASRLNQDHSAADGSKFRSKIRGKLGRVPAEQPDTSHATSRPLNNDTGVASTTGNIRLAVTVTPGGGNDSDTLSTGNASSTWPAWKTLQQILNEMQSLVTSGHSPVVTTGQLPVVTSGHSPVVTSGQSTADLLSFNVSAVVSADVNSSATTITSTTTTASTTASTSSTSTTASTATVSVVRVAWPSSTLSQAAERDLFDVTVRPQPVSSTSILSSSSSSSLAVQSDSLYHVTLLTVAVFSLSVSLIFTCLSTSSCCISTPPPHHSTTSRSSPPRSPCPVAVFVVTALFQFFQASMEWTFTGLAVPFASSVLSWTRPWSVSLLLVYWMSVSLGRILSQWILVRVRPWLLLFAAQLLACLTSLLMLAGSLQRTPAADVDALIWLSAAVLGLCTSVVVATSFQLSASWTSVSMAVSLGCGLGEATVPCLSATLSQLYSSNTFIIAAVFIASLPALTTSILIKYVSSTAAPLNSSHFRLLDSAGVEELDGMMAVDEEAELLSQDACVAMETSLSVTVPSSSSSSSSSLPVSYTHLTLPTIYSV